MTAAAMLMTVVIDDDAAGEGGKECQREYDEGD